MLSREENELITRVGRGTAMGKTMRIYWIPALLSREIAEPRRSAGARAPDGEDLVAFRDTQRRVGLLDEYCLHRRASLFFGRNEECGLRCIYHGWKFDGTATNPVELTSSLPRVAHTWESWSIPTGAIGWTTKARSPLYSANG
jgi:nitrite reductase/ring-hydroxylating ferredoxin subunit